MATEYGFARRNYKKALGFGYILAITACGMVLYISNSSLDDVAINCGTTSTKVGTVFIAKGLGTGVGAMISPKVYLSMRGNSALSVGLLLLAAALLAMPYVSTVLILHLVYFMLGVLFDIITMGCQIMTRRVHGDKSGIWIGTNLAVLGGASALATLICYVDTSLFQQFAMTSATSLSAAVYLGIALPAPEKFEGFLEATPKFLSGSAAAVEELISRSSSMKGKCSLFFQKYSVEIHISGMLFSLSGGMATAGAYLYTYVEYTDIIPESQEPLLMVDFWVSSAVGIVAGLFDQRTCTLPSLYRHSTVAFLTAGAVGSAILVFRDSVVVLWVFIGLFGLACGPMMGYTFELNNRISVPSATGMSIVTFGLSFGSVAVPYATSFVLDYTGSAAVFIVINVLSRLVPYPLMLNAKRITESRTRRGREGVVGWGGGLSSPSSSVSEVNEETRLL